MFLVAKHYSLDPMLFFERPAWFFQWALMTMNAEGYAEQEQMEEVKKKTRRRIA